MGFKINISGSEIDGALDIGNRLKVDGKVDDISIDITNSKIRKGFSVLNDSQINAVETDIKTAMKGLDKSSTEYKELKNIFYLEDRQTRKQLLMEHMHNFASGIVSNIVSGYLQSKL